MYAAPSKKMPPRSGPADEKTVCIRRQKDFKNLKNIDNFSLPAYNKDSIRKIVRGNMFKKIVTLMLVFALALGLAGCIERPTSGGKNPPTENTQPEDPD